MMQTFRTLAYRTNSKINSETKYLNSPAIAQNNVWLRCKLSCRRAQAGGLDAPAESSWYSKEWGGRVAQAPRASKTHTFARHQQEDVSNWLPRTSPVTCAVSLKYDCQVVRAPDQDTGSKERPSDWTSSASAAVMYNTDEYGQVLSEHARRTSASFPQLRQNVVAPCYANTIDDVPPVSHNGFGAVWCNSHTQGSNFTPKPLCAFVALTFNCSHCNALGKPLKLSAGWMPCTLDAPPPFALA